MLKCPKCEYRVSRRNSLRTHASKLHGITSEDLYLTIFLNNIKPACACGCGELVQFVTFTKGYSKFVLGHASKINNNWGHNKKAREKSLKVRYQRKLWNKNPWNKGLNKNLDSRLKSAGDTIKQKNGKRYSEIMRKNRLKGVIPTLIGSKHPRWKGGTSSIGMMCHSDNRLYREWKLPKLKSALFRCSNCASSKNLHVHHDNTKMSEIIRLYREQILDQELSHLQKKWVVDCVVNYHINQNISGIVLCKLCHEDLHSNLNFSV